MSSTHSPLRYVTCMEFAQATALIHSAPSIRCIDSTAWQHAGGIWYSPIVPEEIENRNVNTETMGHFMDSIATGQHVQLPSGTIVAGSAYQTHWCNSYHRCDPMSCASGKPAQQSATADPKKCWRGFGLAEPRRWVFAIQFSHANR